MMELRDRQVPFGNALTETKMGVVMRMRRDDEITKLLYYNEADALGNGAYVVDDAVRRKVYGQDSGSTKVFLSNYDVYATEEVRAQVNISFQEIQTTQDSTVKIPILSVMVNVSAAINVLDDGMSLRHELLFQKINDAIEGYSVGKLSVVKLMDAEEATTEGNTHKIYSARYKVGELRN